MKKIITSIIIVIFYLTFVDCGNTPETNDSKMVLYLCYESGDIQAFEYNTTDFRILDTPINVHWQEDGCVLSYIEVAEEKSSKLSIDDSTTITIQSIPTRDVYRFCLLSEGDSFPVEWQDIIHEKERKEQWQADFGSYGYYKKARNEDKEKEVIQNAFDIADIPLTAENWYEVFLEATWENAISFTLLNAESTKVDNEWVCLTMMDTENNKIEIYGISDDLIDLVYYNGNYCYGPLLG